MDALAEQSGWIRWSFASKNIPRSVRQERAITPYTLTGLRQWPGGWRSAIVWMAASKKRTDTSGKNRNWREGSYGKRYVVCRSGGPPSTIIVKLSSTAASASIWGQRYRHRHTDGHGHGGLRGTGVRPEVIEIENADTGTTQVCDGKRGEQNRPNRIAGRFGPLQVHLKQQLMQMAAERSQGEAASLVLQGERFARSTILRRRSRSRYHAVEALRGSLSASGIAIRIRRTGQSTPSPLQFCEVEVNIRTGEVRILRFLSAQ